MTSEKSFCESPPTFREMERLSLPTRGPKTDSSELLWAKMTPMEWITDLNTKAKVAEENNYIKTPSRNEATIPASAGYDFVIPQFGQNPTVSYVPGGEWQQPLVPDASSPLGTLPPEVEEFVSDVNPTALPLFWDFGCLHPTEQVERIRLLVLAIEGQTNFMEMKTAFEQVRDHFTYSLPQCHASEDFDRLCQETIDDLQALLVTLVKNPQKGNGTEIAQPATRAASGNIRSSPATPNRAFFHNHMNNWLRANWINPYPDEAVSHQLAYETGETLHVVNTWLVNARSRRWRPAVLRAFELNRPSELLWEDSIALFEDKPLRSLDEQSFSSPTKRFRLK